MAGRKAVRAQQIARLIFGHESPKSGAKHVPQSRKEAKKEKM
jgi:hypothetical protein